MAKESIFTGVNNFNTFTITDVDFGEYFGFTDAEVKEMLEEYQLGSIDPLQAYGDHRELSHIGLAQHAFLCDPQPVKQAFITINLKKADWTRGERNNG